MRAPFAIAVFVVISLTNLGCGQQQNVVLAIEDTAAETEMTDSPGEDAPTETVETFEDPPPQGRGPLHGRRICIDPGHDAYWAVGATGYTSAGSVARHPTEGVALYEHEMTLSVAYRLKASLEEDGAAVCVTRRSRAEGGGLEAEPYDFNGDGRVRSIGVAIEDTPEVIQPRIDQANHFGAQVLVSLHFNGSEDRRLRGTEVYFTDGGPRREEGRALAEALLRGTLEGLRAAGYEGFDRGIRSDAYQRYSPAQMRLLLAKNAATVRANGYDPTACPECYRLMTLGNNPMSLHAGLYVGALIEIDFLSSPEFVEGFLMRPDAFDVIAAGLQVGLRRYFAVD